jgi:phosphoribosyl 1,2-cyclic phosphodiesterase
MNYIKFLGTAGARVVVCQQLRASGGIWLSLDNTNILLDPGPGALVRCMSSKPKLDPTRLHGIILSHRHLDHSGDINVMIEAMTSGGFKKRGIVFAPSDALSDDPVILKYAREYVEGIQILSSGNSYNIGNISFSTPIKHIHGKGETYGMNFNTKSYLISYISDTRFFPDLINHYRGDILIINVVRLNPSDIDHLCIDDAKKIIENIQPKVAILTHFGMTMLRAKPWVIAENLSHQTKVKVIAATDGMLLDLDSL